MALRLIEASSSLWPPDRKVMPFGEEDNKGLSCASLFRKQMDTSDIVACFEVSANIVSLAKRISVRICLIYTPNIVTFNSICIKFIA